MTTRLAWMLREWTMRSAISSCGIILLALSACNSLPATTVPPAPTVGPSPTVAALAEPTTTPTGVPTPSTSANIVLTVWAPEEFSPESARGGPVLQKQIEEFTRSHPDTRVSYSLKSRSGKGGLLSFLLQVQGLIPSRLPDIIIIDSRELDVLANSGMLQPLDQDLTAGTMADLLSSAQKLARVDGRWVALPLTLDVQHLVYNKDSVRVPPSTWDDLLAGTAQFAFPADDDDAFLFQYLANRGRISSSTPVIPLDISITTSILTLFQRARAAKLVPDSTLSVKTAHDVWPLFQQGQVALAQVEANDYISERGRTPNAGFAPLPTADGTGTGMVDSWNMVILTTDPTRHALAADYLAWVDDPERLAEWASAAQYVPARRSAFVSAVTPSEYADFLRRLLDAGMPAPTFADRAPYQAGMHTALQSVLRGQATPSEAALRAAQGLP